MQYKIFIPFLIFFFSLKCFGQNYNFNGTISREVLENYLEKSITMQGQSDIQGSNMLSETQRLENIVMLDDIGAKFIGRIAGWWENGWGQTNHDNFFKKCSTNVANIHTNDPQVICQAAVFEYVSATVETFSVPTYVFQDLGLPIQNRTFKFSEMLYPAPASQYTIYGNPMSENDRQFIPDITRIETQMWFYYMATRYISVGCEAIHFGQAEIMNRRDIGNKSWWGLLQKIRKYASTKNRGIVVCDAHVPCGGMYYEPNTNLTQSQWNSYCPTNNANGSLLFDFHSMWIGWKESSPCSTTYQPATFGIDLNSAGLHGRSLGGISPQGWQCFRNPYLVEFDNGGVATQVGCNYNVNQDWFLWGWDDISWFALQQEAKRNEILKYAYYKIKCIDINGHLEMPGMRGVTPGNGGAEWNYRANTGYQNQQLTIKEIWNNSYASDFNWVHHDFTSEEVINQPNPAMAKSDVVFAGSDKMYYIGTDSRVHGYINYNGTWWTVSPSWTAHSNGQNINSQVKAQSDLILSPDNSTLYYIGVDGLIYRYILSNPSDPWTSYTYSQMPSNSQMLSQGVIAITSLTCVGNDKIFYIAKEPANNNSRRLHGVVFDNNTWMTTSPSWGAHANGQNINTQVQVQDDFCVSPDNSSLYYIGIDGLIYKYILNTPSNVWTTYTYVPMPSNNAMTSQQIKASGTIICPENNLIYYIATEALNNNDVRIHGLVFDNGNWLTISPSWSAHFNGQPISSQNLALSNLVISPDKKLISYYGGNNRLHGFKVNNLWSYEYFDFPISSSISFPIFSCIFKNNEEIFYTSFSDKKIHEYKFEEDYCSNKSIFQIEPSHGRRDEPLIEVNGKGIHEVINPTNITIFPNPASTQLSIKLENTYTSVDIIISDNIGRIINTQSFNSQDEITLNTSKFANGLYHIKIAIDRTNISNHKFLIQQ